MDLNNSENLVLAETKDHWNWETLAAVAPRIGDSELKRMAGKAVSEVRKQEKTHFNSNRCCGSSLRAHRQQAGEDIARSSDAALDARAVAGNHQASVICRVRSRSRVDRSTARTNLSILCSPGRFSRDEATNASSVGAPRGVVAA
jgi:hypothetical protein